MSRLCIFRARSILLAFVVPKLNILFPTEDWSAQPDSINFVSRMCLDLRRLRFPGGLRRLRRHQEDPVAVVLLGQEAGPGHRRLGDAQRLHPVPGIRRKKSAG